MRGSLIKRRYTKYLIALLVIVAIGLFVRGRLTSPGSTSSTDQNARTVLKPAVATKEIQKDYGIGLVSDSGEEIEGAVMRLESVELRDEIIVKGQKATSAEGRIFLVINMKLVNNLEQGIEINTKDYLRVGVSESEWLAPDIHNDPVLVQAISTKPTRVAFPVDAKLRQFTLQVGEITGDKEKVDIEFTK